MIASADIYITWAFLLWGCLLAVGVGLSALYSGMETGIYQINKFRLELRCESGSRSARLLKRLLSNYNNLLAVLLIGTNIAAYAATFAISAMFMLGGAGGATHWYTIAAATPILFIFGEAVPKNIFHRLAERLVYRLSWLLSVSSIIFQACGLSPLLRGFSWLLMRLTAAGRRDVQPVGYERFAAIVAEGRASGVLTHSQSIMADRVVRLSRIRLVDVMVAMKSACVAPQEISRDELIDLVSQHNYSRIPLLNSSGNVAGILDIYDVLLDEGLTKPATLARAPLVLPANTTVTDALCEMQRSRTAMAVVTAANEKHIGIVTIKDLVEEIVGELQAW